MQNKQECLIEILKTQINVLEIQDSTRNSFLRCQRSYFALANIWLHRYDSFFKCILLFSGDINVNPQSFTKYLRQTLVFM